MWSGSAVAGGSSAATTEPAGAMVSVGVSGVLAIEAPFD